jgi:dipeptidyl aminopeptidase/acylaminoacyl peptidase
LIEVLEDVGMHMLTRRNSLAEYKKKVTIVLSIFVISIFASAQSKPKHLVTFDDLGQTAMTESLQLSPDGHMLAYSFGRFANSLRDSDILIVNTALGSTPRNVVKGTLPSWSPDSKRLAYYAGPPGDFQIWVVDVVSGKAEQLTHVARGINPDPQTRILGWELEAMSLVWSPDGSKLMFASRVESKTAASVPSESAQSYGPGQKDRPVVLNGSTPPEWTLAGIYAPAFSSSGGSAEWEKKGDTEAGKLATLSRPLVNQLFLVDVRTKQVKQFTTDDAGYFSPQWSRDGKTVLCVSSEERPNIGYGPVETNVYEIEVSSGKKVALTNAPDIKWRPKWSLDGNWVAYVVGGLFGHTILYVVPSNGGTPRSLTSSLDRYVEDYQWGPDSRSIVLLVRDGVSESIVQLDLATDEVHSVSTGEASRNHISASRDGTLSWQQSDGTLADGLWVRPANGAFASFLVNLNPETSSWELGKQEVIQWKNGHGEDIQGILLLPVGYQAGHKYAMIVDCYPGTSNFFRSVPYMGNQAWASHGYVVLFTAGTRTPYTWINPMKSSKYDLAAKGPHGLDVTFDDVMSGVDEVIRDGYADPDRMGLFGFSNGGAVVQMLITRTNRFKAAVSHAGVPLADLTSAYLHESKFLDGWHTWIGFAPWEDPQGFLELSSIYRLNQVTTPVLLADGDLDGHFLLNTIEVYNGLRALGKDVTFVRYPEQSHVLTGWAEQDFLKRTMDFFDAHLRPRAVSQ